MFSAKIDFTNPFVIRKWLQMLEVDDEVGYLLRPGMRYPSRVLGFSIDSNRFGLRGPSAEKADNVILGTSYGMGFGVNVGCNWYELGLDVQNWFNAALPVGPSEWRAILDRFYRGNYEHALFIYHPNFIQHGVTYLKWKQSNKNIFDYLGWKTSLKGCVKLRAGNLLREPQKIRSGRVIYLRENFRKYKINATYANLGDADLSLCSEVCEALLKILSRFKRVTVVRARIKEEQVPPLQRTDWLQRSLGQYEMSWNATRTTLQKHGSISFHDSGELGLTAYNPYDTHWNALGNQLFASYISREFHNFE